MILKITGIVSVLLFIQGTNGASYSKVYVQNGGSDVVPIEYVNYGPPAVVADPQIARISAPVVSVPPVSSVIPPCVSPCFVAPNIAPGVPIPNAKFITYSAPNVPVVVAPSKDNGYEYSYIVYDEDTGDRKVQREISDGSVVRGEYSFVQPDGFVREVQYRADDLTGFNVVVKNVMPDSIGDDKKQEKAGLPPCKDVKNEALKEEPPTTTPEVETETPVDHSSDNHECHDHDGDGKEDHASEDHPEPTEPAPETETTTTTVIESKTEEVRDAPWEIVSDPKVEPTPKESENLVETESVPKPSSNDSPASDATSGVIVVPDEPTAAVVVPQLPVPLPPNFVIPSSSLAISYDDIIRCIQSRAQTQQPLNISPLTYIILPAANRPC